MFTENNFTFKIKKNNRWVEISKEEFDNITLESGRGIPNIHGFSTIINNYIGTFWTHILKPRNFMVLFQLIKYCYGNRDHAWPSLETLAAESGMSENSVREAIKALEDYGFALTVQVYENGTQKTNLYFVRKSTPFITTDMYHKLPKSLQQKHDKFIHDLSESGYIRIDDVPNYNNNRGADFEPPHSESEPLQNLNPEGAESEPYPSESEPPQKPDNNRGANFEPYPSESEPLQNLNPGGADFESRRVQNLNPNKNNNNKNNMNNVYINLNKLIHDKLKQKISKPSYDTWYKNSYVVKVEGNTIYLKVPNEFSKNWIEEKHMDLLLNILKEIDNKDSDIKIIL